MSRETLWLACDRPLAVDQRIRLVIEWPAKLPDGTSLSVWILGKIIECAAGRVEVRIGSYEFRTRRAAKPAHTPRVGSGAGIRSLTAGS